VDEVLLITGSSGIAAAVARMWAAEDSVFVFGVNENECRSLADELAGRRNLALVGDALGPRFLQLAMLEGYRAAVDPTLLPPSSRLF